VNPGLAVELFGVRAHEGGWAGVVVTPWCMNVVFMPPARAPVVKPGTKRPRVFPSGTLEFTVGHLDGVGVVESCSLFSPMDEFPDMATARRVAQEAVDALFTAEPTVAPPPPAPAPSRRDLFRRAFALR
jgi:[NiFe] hydrogenase assembly HybE family chaperone